MINQPKTTSTKKWFVIVNPTSGNGTSKKMWPKINQLLIQSGFDFTFAFTEYLNHSINLTETSINQGIKNIICVGGDGTLHNIINGIMSQNLVVSTAINVGVIPIGTGNDWVRTYNIPSNYKKAITIIKRGNTRQQDIGKINLLNGNKNTLYFNNLVGVGFDGLVVSKVEKYKSLGSMAYLVGAMLSLFAFRNFKTTLYFNDNSYKTKSLMVLVGLCKYSGAGMQLTKEPSPSDGKFDISIAGDLSKMEIIANLKNLFNGNIVDYKKVTTYKTDMIKIIIDEKEIPFIEADGELIGKGSFSVSIIPNAFTFYC